MEIPECLPFLACQLVLSWPSSMLQEIYYGMRKAFSLLTRWFFSLKFKDFNVIKTFGQEVEVWGRHYYGIYLVENLVSKNALANTPTVSVKEKLALPPKGEDLNKGIDLSYSKVPGSDGIPVEVLPYAKSALSCHPLLRRCWEWVWDGMGWDGLGWAGLGCLTLHAQEPKKKCSESWAGLFKAGLR